MTRLFGWLQLATLAVVVSAMGFGGGQLLLEMIKEVMR